MASAQVKSPSELSHLDAEPPFGPWGREHPGVGDNEACQATAKAVARRLGVDDVAAEALEGRDLDSSALREIKARLAQRAQGEDRSGREALP